MAEEEAVLAESKQGHAVFQTHPEQPESDRPEPDHRLQSRSRPSRPWRIVERNHGSPFIERAPLMIDRVQ